MFEAHAKRTAVKHVREMKNAMISGIWGNSDIEDKKGSIARVEDFARSAIAEIYGTTQVDDVDFENDPFFKAMKVPEIPSIDHNKDREKVDDLS
jgi:hypothetical protein